MQFPFFQNIYSEEETTHLARTFSSVLKKGDAVALNGNLGSGKTFFTRAICREFQIENANSPSFTILNIYYGSQKIFHFDFYRIRTEHELLNIGIYDYLNDEESISIIEWADMFPGILPARRYEVKIIINDDFSRSFTIDKV